MTHLYKPTYLTKNAQQKQLLNTIVGNHDLICNCEEPLKHIGLLIFEKAKPSNFTEEEKKLIKKCLGEEEATGDRDADDGFTDGDLAALFTEEATETG